MNNNFSLIDFMADYSSDDDCLQCLFNIKYASSKICPKCENKFIYKRVKGRKSYQCSLCGHQIYPMKESLFEKTTTKLSKWFYVFYLISTSEKTLTSKDIERQLEVCYKTAHRMQKLIRRLYVTHTSKLKGEIEIREIKFFKKSARWSKYNKSYKEKKGFILFVLQRNGICLPIYLQQYKKELIRDVIYQYVEPQSIIYSSTWKFYELLGDKFKHKTFDPKNREYTRGEVHTNNLNSLISKLTKNMKIHKHIDEKYLINYCNEIVFKYNYSDLSTREIFNKIIYNSVSLFD